MLPIAIKWTKCGVISDDVHDLMRQREGLHRSFDPHAKWIKYRRVLVDWMCEAGDELISTCLRACVCHVSR